MMLPTYLKQTGYTSCIKIFGVPILPPLVTEERRKELNDDKQKAIDIEKRLKGKRNSIDSGVMTGSYIDNLKSNESQQTDEVSLHLLSLHGGIYKENIQNGISSLSSEEADYGVSDSFLKNALEDPQFREYFTNTAEKIFKDNRNISDLPGGGNSAFGEVNCVSSEGNNKIYSSCMLSETTSLVKPLESLDFSFNNSLTQVPSSVESVVTSKCSETTLILEEKQTEKEHLSPSPPRVRRNSYTLESPSPVLLEHMAKEIANSNKKAEKWQPLPDRNEKVKNSGFKPFSGRKTWNKKICNPISTTKVENLRNKHTLRRSKTFVKLNTKAVESNYSLPPSSRTSPLQFHPFTQSVDCIRTMVSRLSEKENKDDINLSSESMKQTNVLPISDVVCDTASDKDTIIVNKDVKPESAVLEISPTLLVNNSSSSKHSHCGTDTSCSPQFEYSDSASQISVTTQSTFLQQNLMSPRSSDNRIVHSNPDRTEDFDDIASLCSSMSISRFLPAPDISRPSTADDLSEVSIRQLKIKHENELRELLEKQQKEEEIYSRLLSNSGSVSSQTTTHLTIGDLFDINSEILIEDKRRNSCNRELFPAQKHTPDANYSRKDHYSEKEKKAAIILTAYAKGYLTRRLLKTEKVQQLIELIKESLNCAFSLQLEPQLKQNDLELHERLAHQLSAALYELQMIIASPAETRMAIIAADRERLRKPLSRPSSAISSATRKSMLRRQKSLNSAEKVPQESRTRTKSLSMSANAGSITCGPRPKGDSSSTVSTSSSRKPWR